MSATIGMPEARAEQWMALGRAALARIPADPTKALNAAQMAFNTVPAGPPEIPPLTMMGDALRRLERFSQVITVLEAVADLGVPRIHFGVGTGELLGAMGEAGADVVGVDFRVALDEASRRVGPQRAVQGNLDPALLFAPAPVLERRGTACSTRAGPAPPPA